MNKIAAKHIEDIQSLISYYEAERDTTMQAAAELVWVTDARYNLERKVEYYRYIINRLEGAAGAIRDALNV